MGKRRKSPSTRSTKKRNPKTVAFWAFMAVALVAGAGMYWATSARGAADSYVSSYTPDSAPALMQAPVQYPLPADPRLLVIGDSWTWGQGVTPNTQGYAYQVGDLMKWPAEVNGGRGTGYVTDSKTPDAENPARFPARVKIMPTSLVVQNPNIIIIQGSINDLAQPPIITKAATDTLRDLKSRFPEAVVVVFGPIFPPDVISSKRVQDVQAALRDAASDTGSAFIDPTQGERFIPDDQWANAMGPDSHPNTVGHQLIANELATRLKVLFNV